MYRFSCNIAKRPPDASLPGKVERRGLRAARKARRLRPAGTCLRETFRTEPGDENKSGATADNEGRGRIPNNDAPEDSASESIQGLVPKCKPSGLAQYGGFDKMSTAPIENRPTPGVERWASHPNPLIPREVSINLS